MHALAGLLAVGIAAVIAGSRSFAAIGQWGSPTPGRRRRWPQLGVARGPAEESTFRRAFALVSADALGIACLSLISLPPKNSLAISRRTRAGLPPQSS